MTRERDARRRRRIEWMALGVLFLGLAIAVGTYAGDAVLGIVVVGALGLCAAVEYLLWRLVLGRQQDEV